MPISNLFKSAVFLIAALTATGLQSTLYAQSPEHSRPISSVPDSTELIKRIEGAAELGKQYPDSVRNLLTTLYRQSKAIGYSAGMRSTLKHLIPIEQDAKRYQQTLLLTDRLLALSDPVKNREDTYIAYWQKADALYLMNEYYPASNAYTKALQFIPDSYIRYKPLIYGNIAAIFQTLALPEKASGFYDMAIITGYQYNDSSTLCMAYLGKGYLYRMQKDYAKSGRYIDSAMLIATQYRLANRMQYALVYKADLLNQQKKYQQALQTLNEAEKLYQEQPDHHKKLEHSPLYRLHLVKGDTYMFSGKYQKAITEYRKALDTVGRDNNGRSYLLHSLSHAYAQAGRYKEAFDLHCATRNLNDSLIKKEATQKANELEVQYRVAQKDKELALKNAQISLAQKNLAQKNLFIVSISLGSLVLLSIIFHLYRSYGKKKKLAEQEKEIAALQAAMEGEERERKRLSRELHDGVGGMLAALKLKINNLKKNNPEPGLMYQIHDVLDMLQDTSAEVRNTAHNLLPDILTRLSLTEALTHYIESINQAEELRINLYIPCPLPPLNKSAELILYRTVQELVQNVLKHAQAHHIEIQLLALDGQLTLTVEDDGIGFDVQAKGGYGLENLRYRVQALQGEIDIDTAPGQNTTIRIAFHTEKLILIANA